MPTRTIERGQWQSYFDQVSRHLPASKIDVEIDAPELGAQHEASDLRLEGLSYDPRDDAFSIVAEGLEHRISHPNHISVLEEENHLAAIEVVDDEQRKHVARLTESLRLPSR